MKRTAVILATLAAVMSTATASANEQMFCEMAKSELAIRTLLAARANAYEWGDKLDSLAIALNSGLIPVDDLQKKMLHYCAEDDFEMVGPVVLGEFFGMSIAYSTCQDK